MAASLSDIKSWLAEGKRRGATHVVVACDTYDHDDYPKYVMPGEDPRQRARNLGDMQVLMEVYWLGGTEAQLGQQLRMHRSHTYGPEDLAP